MLRAKVKIIVESRAEDPSWLGTRGLEKGMLVPCDCFAVQPSDGMSIMQWTVDSWQEKVES